MIVQIWPKTFLSVLAFFAVVSVESVLSQEQSSTSTATILPKSTGGDPNVQVDFTGQGKVYRVKLPDIVEGLQYQYVFRLLNRSEHTWSGVRSEVGCQCIRVTKQSGDILNASGHLDLHIEVIPTVGNFSQEVRLFTKLPADPEERLLCKLILSAKTTPVIDCSHHTAVFGDKGCVELTIRAADSRFHILHEELQMADESFSCSGTSDGSVVNVVIRQSPPNQVASDFRKSTILNVPLRFEGHDEVFWHRQELSLAS